MDCKGLCTEIKRCFLLGRKTITKLDSILKSETLLCQQRSSSHVWMWELGYKELSTEDLMVFELWCWRRLLRVPWTARRSNQSILKELSPEYSLEGLMLKLKLQYFDHLMRRFDTFEKTLMLGKIEGRRRRGRQRMRCLVDLNDSLDISLSKLWELVMDREAFCVTVHWITKSQKWQSDWTELNWLILWACTKVTFKSSTT